MSKLQAVYADSGNELNPYTKQLIENYISSKPSFDISAGIPGAHAEVQALNKLYNSVPNPAIIDLSRINIATNKLGKSSYAGQQGGAFTACTNCSGIIPSQINVITGRK